MPEMMQEHQREIWRRASARYRATAAYKANRPAQVARYVSSEVGRANRVRLNAERKAKMKVRNQDEWGRFVTKEIYALRVQREKTTGFKWHVDHIVPLNGEQVSGLHVWNNLQVIPAEDNLAKRNYHGG